MSLSEQLASDRVKEIHLVVLCATILRAADISERVAVRIACDILEETVKQHARRFEGKGCTCGEAYGRRAEGTPKCDYCVKGA